MPYTLFILNVCLFRQISCRLKVILPLKLRLSVFRVYGKHRFILSW